MLVSAGADAEVALVSIDVEAGAVCVDAAALVSVDAAAFASAEGAAGDAAALAAVEPLVEAAVLEDGAVVAVDAAGELGDLVSSANVGEVHDIASNMPIAKFCRFVICPLQAVT